MKDILPKSKGNIPEGVLTRCTGLLQRIRDWFCENKTVLLAAFGVALVVYFPFYSDFLSNPDGVLYWDQMKTPDWALSHATWSWLIFNHIRPGFNIVPLPILLGLAFYCIGGAVFLDIFDIEKKPLKVFLLMSIVCAPFIPSTITYPYLAYDYGISFLLSTVSIKLIIKSKRSLTEKLVGGVLLVLMLGGGKTLIGVSLAAVLMAFAFSIIKDQNKWKEHSIELCKNGILIVCALVAYYCIFKMLLVVKNVQISTYGGADKITPFYIIMALPRSVKLAYSNFFDFFFKNTIMINSFAVKDLNRCIFALFVAAVIYYCIRLRKNIISLILFVLSIALMPLACNAIDIFAPDYGGITLHMAGGVTIFIPFAFFLIFSAISEVKTPLKKYINVPVGILLVCLIWNYVLIDCADASYMKVTKALTISAANRVYTSIEMDPRYTNDMKVIVSGVPQYSLNLLPYSGAVNQYARWGMFWSDDFYQSLGWQIIFRYYIDGNVKWGNWDEINSVIASDEYMEMPGYPNNESMKVINGIFVVKFPK